MRGRVVLRKLHVVTPGVDAGFTDSWLGAAERVCVMEDAVTFGIGVFSWCLSEVPEREQNTQHESSNLVRMLKETEMFSI